jgi:saccharopine dehydrogenase (NAD+, L-lysine-forming)
MLEGLPHGGAIRKSGRIIQVPAAWKTKMVPFADRPRLAVSIPWGDIATAYHSTGIPNIVTYMAAPPRLVNFMRLAGRIGWLLGAAPVQRMLARIVDSRVKGPDAVQRERTRTQLWGRVTSPDGRSAEATLETPEGYQLTMLAGVEIAARILDGRVEPGAVTPSMAFGAGFVTEIEGCRFTSEPTTA